MANWPPSYLAYDNLNLGLFQVFGEDVEVEAILRGSPKRPESVPVGVRSGTRGFCPANIQTFIQFVGSC